MRFIKDRNNQFFVPYEIHHETKLTDLYAKNLELVQLSKLVLVTQSVNNRRFHPFLDSKTDAKSKPSSIRSSRNQLENRF